MAFPKGYVPPNAGKGREKGVPNKITKQLKDMILGALDDAGGQAYLARQAEENPAAFMTLVGKVLPVTLADTAGNSLPIITVQFVDAVTDSGDVPPKA